MRHTGRIKPGAHANAVARLGYGSCKELLALPGVAAGTHLRVPGDCTAVEHRIQELQQPRLATRRAALALLLWRPPGASGPAPGLV